MNILHATTDPSLLVRRKQMLESARRADSAVGYVFMPGSHAVVELVKQRLTKARSL